MYLNKNSKVADIKYNINRRVRCTEAGKLLMPDGSPKIRKKSNKPRADKGSKRLYYKPRMRHLVNEGCNPIENIIQPKLITAL